MNLTPCITTKKKNLEEILEGPLVSSITDKGYTTCTLVHDVWRLEIHSSLAEFLPKALGSTSFMHKFLYLVSLH